MQRKPTGPVRHDRHGKPRMRPEPPSGGSPGARSGTFVTELLFAARPNLEASTMKSRFKTACLSAVLLVSACGTNPVTGKREIQFVSASQEVQIGQQNYAPMRQSEGGDYAVLPDLTAYVNEVGQK